MCVIPLHLPCSREYYTKTLYTGLRHFKNTPSQSPLNIRKGSLSLMNHTYTLFQWGITENIYQKERDWQRPITWASKRVAYFYVHKWPSSSSHSRNVETSITRPQGNRKLTCTSYPSDTIESITTNLQVNLRYYPIFRPSRDFSWNPWHPGHVEKVSKCLQYAILCKLGCR